jgi:tetratricopeptide (TPR) repeat protein
LGEASSREQEWKAAVEQFNRSLELNPNFDEAMTGLARALHGTGNDAEAKTWLHKAVTANPENYKAWYELGSLEAKNDRPSALVDYEKALSIQPNFALAHREFGVLLLQEKDYEAAGKHLAEAAKLGLEEAPVYNFLGITYSRTGRVRDGIQSYRHALKLQPDLAEAHLNLAYAYQRMNRVKAAREEYAAACGLEQSFCQFVPH